MRCRRDLLRRMLYVLVVKTTWQLILVKVRQLAVGGDERHQIQGVKITTVTGSATAASKV